jgi:hypothetical protein
MGGVDKYGVVATYATGQISYNFNLNPNDGMRWDFGSLGGGLNSPFASNELICYVSCDSPPDDETSFKQGGGRHSSGSNPRCYDIGIDNNNGSTRYRTEDSHPDYEEGASGGKAKPVTSAWVGYKAVKFNKGSYVLLEVYDDAGNNESTPANQWRKVSSWKVTDPLWLNPPSDHVATIRADKIDEDLKDYKIKWISLRGILSTDVESGAVPGTGGGSTGGGGPIGGGGSTGGGTTPGSGYGGVGGGYGGIGSGGGGTSSGDGSGGTGSGVVTPIPVEKPILFEQKRVMFRWNINHISGDACGIGKNPETLPLRNIYQVQGDNIYVEGKNYTRCGIYIAKNSPTNPLEKSMFIDKYLRYWEMTIKKYGPDTLNGFIYFRIRDKYLNIVQEIGTISANALTGNDQQVFFNVPYNQRQTQLGDHFSIEYNGNSQTNYFKVLVTYGDKIDGANTVGFVYDGVKYIYDPLMDLAGIAGI